MNVIKVVWIRAVIYSFSTTRKHLALAWWQIFLNQLTEISDDICSLCFPGGMRYGTIQVHCEEVITSPDIWIKRQLCLPEQPSAPLTQRVFVDCLEEKKHCCAHIQSNWRHESHRRMVAGGWASVSHIIWTPRKKERKGAGEREEKWNKNILLTWKLYQKLRLLQALPPNPSCHYHTFPLYLFPRLQKEPNTAISGCSLVPKLFKSSHLLTMYTNKRGENESKTHPQGPSLQLTRVSCQLSASFPWQEPWKYQLWWLHW